MPDSRWPQAIKAAALLVLTASCRSPETPDGDPHGAGGISGAAGNASSGASGLGGGASGDAGNAGAGNTGTGGNALGGSAGSVTGGDGGSGATAGSGNGGSSAGGEGGTGGAGGVGGAGGTGGESYPMPAQPPPDEDGAQLWLRYVKVPLAGRLAEYQAAAEPRRPRGQLGDASGRADRARHGAQRTPRDDAGRRRSPTGDGALVIGTPASSTLVSGLALGCAPDGGG